MRVIDVPRVPTATPEQIWSARLAHAERRHRTLVWITHQPAGSAAAERMKANSGRAKYLAEAAFQAAVARRCRQGLACAWRPCVRALRAGAEALDAERRGDLPASWRAWAEFDATIFKREAELRSRAELRFSHCGTCELST